MYIIIITDNVSRVQCLKGATTGAVPYYGHDKGWAGLSFPAVVRLLRHPFDQACVEGLA